MKLKKRSKLGYINEIGLRLPLLLRAKAEERG
jgi:hypothetical protein